ncbi:MAG TPA: hypothetical protein VFN67_32980 [Polyangiales bacterium]|jgi:hypothetical protein|nr:hypothetical protein [Polyangiales bacterium]
MMNKPAWLFGTTSVLLGGVCLALLQRSQPAQEVHQTPDEVLQTQLEQTRAERDRLETVVNSLRAAPAAAALAAPPPMAASSTAPQPMGMTRVDFSPTARRMSMRLHNGKIFRDLGLSDAQIESLLDVLVAQQNRATEPKSLLQAASGGDADARARDRAEITAVIGKERAEELDDWQRRAQSRFELRRIRDQLEDSGEPLSDAQQKRLSELMQAQTPAAPPPREKDEAPEVAMERFRAWRNENREQMRKQVSAVLEPRQLERYEEMDAVSREFEKSLPPRPFPGLQAPAPAGQAAPPPAPPR